MASQLEVRLERQIQGESDLSLQAILKAKLACYLARVGEFDRAENIRVDLRLKFGDGRFVRVSILLMLLEGLMLYYRDLSPNARDRIFRANVLSSTFRVNELTALTSAWLAHIDFNRCHFATMMTEIQKCKEFISYDDGSANCRVSLVLGDAFLYSGQKNLSQIWYERARIAATALGDQAAIGALTYNRAALNVQNLRFKSLDAKVAEEEITTALAELQTATNYQSLARLKSLDHLLCAANVGINMVKKNYGAAALEASGLINSQNVPIGSGEYYILLSDLARCRVVASEFNSAKEVRERIIEIEVLKLDEDDKAIIFDNLAAVSAALGETDLLAIYMQMKADSKNSFAVLVRELMNALGSYKDPMFST